jgi:hypothetical protein
VMKHFNFKADEPTLGEVERLSESIVRLEDAVNNLSQREAGITQSVNPPRFILKHHEKQFGAAFLVRSARPSGWTPSPARTPARGGSSRSSRWPTTAGRPARRSGVSSPGGAGSRALVGRGRAPIPRGLRRARPMRAGPAPAGDRSATAGPAHLGRDLRRCAREPRGRLGLPGVASEMPGTAQGKRPTVIGRSARCGRRECLVPSGPG